MVASIREYFKEQTILKNDDKLRNDYLYFVQLVNRNHCDVIWWRLYVIFSQRTLLLFLLSYFLLLLNHTSCITILIFKHSIAIWKEMAVENCPRPLVYFQHFPSSFLDDVCVVSSCIVLWQMENSLCYLNTFLPLV